MKFKVDRVNFKGNFPLSLVAIAGPNDEIVKALLEVENIDINQRTKSGCTPLLLASYYGHLRVVTALLMAGADITAGISSYFFCILSRR